MFVIAVILKLHFVIYENKIFQKIDFFFSFGLLYFDRS